MQALLGGSFKDGALAGLASGLASAASGSLDAKIAEAALNGSMTTAEVFAAKTFSKVLGSAIRAAGSPGDPAQAFASAFLTEVVGRPSAAPAPSPYSLAGAGAVLGNGSSTVRLGTGDDGASLTPLPMASPTPGAFDGPFMTDTSPPRGIAELWNETYGPGSQTVGWTTRDGSSFATQSTGATADLSTMRRAPELDAGFGFPRPADGSVQAYVQANGSVGYLISQGGRSEFFDPARYGVAAQTDGSHDAAELRRFSNHPPVDQDTTPVIQLQTVVVVGQRADVAAAARASLLAGSAAGEVWTLESLTALGSRALGAMPTLADLMNALLELGPRVGAGAALLLTPANAGQRGMVQLNEFQRFETRPGELRGSLQEIDGNDDWQTVKTGVQLVQVGNQRMALTDEEIRGLQAPLINLPPNGPPAGVPALPLPDWADRPELGTPGYEAQAPAGPTTTTTPIAGQDWRDLLIDKSSDAAELGKNLEAAGIHQPYPGYQPHHMVPSEDGGPLMDGVRAKLAALGFKLNSASNGVWLPGWQSVERPGEPAYHQRLHNDEYFEAVADALKDVKTADDAADALSRIRQQLQDNTFPGIRPRPPSKGPAP